MGLESDLISQDINLKDRLDTEIQHLSTILENPEITKGILVKIKPNINEGILKHFSNSGLNEMIHGYLKAAKFVSTASKSSSPERSYMTIGKKENFESIFDSYGLLNSQAFKNLISDEEAKVLSRQGMTFVAMYFDMNGLKATNDDFDHSAGDEAIYHTQKLLEESACYSIRDVFDERKNERRFQKSRESFTSIDRYKEQFGNNRKNSDRREHLGYRLKKEIEEDNSKTEITRFVLKGANLEECIDNEYKISRLGGDEFIIVVSCPEHKSEEISQEYFSKVKENIENNEVLSKYGITLSAGYSTGKNLQEALKKAEKATKLSKIITGHSQNELVKYENDVENYLRLYKILEINIKKCAAIYPNRINDNNNDISDLTEQDLYLSLNNKQVNLLKETNAIDIFLREVNSCRRLAYDDESRSVKINSQGYANLGAVRLNLGEKITKHIYKNINSKKDNYKVESILELLSA